MRSGFAAWLVTGPLGHLWAGVAGWAELLARWWWSRVRVRYARSSRR
jgi:hypothetical protein